MCFDDSLPYSKETKVEEGWLITQDQYVRGGGRGEGEGEAEEIPRSWRNGKDFNDLLHLPRATRVPSSFESWLARERAD